MSPSRTSQNGTKNQFGDLNLSITGIGTEYPPFLLEPSAVDILCDRHYPDTPAMRKIRTINQYTGIDTRSAIGTVDHPMANMDRAPTIAELCSIFLKDGVALAVTAARKALHEARLLPTDITHVVSTTCTNSANPGFDHYVCKALGVTQPVEKVLLHGIGCSGGLASLRTAANLALGASFRGKKARALVIALEISSLLCRSELDSINELQETRIGVMLFSDCASACILSNGIGGEDEEPVYELLGWDHRVIPDTEEDLGFDVDPLGWKVVLSPRVPKLAASVVAPAFHDLLSTLPNLPPNYKSAADFDWALHPGGATILSGVERAMSISPEHMRASYDTYINHGNSSSATIFSVMDRLRQKDMDEIAPGGKVKDFVVGAAFGPGIAVEMCLLKRNLSHVPRVLQKGAGGEATPPETESEGSRSEGEAEPEELEAEIEKVKEQERELGEKLTTVHPELPEQGDKLPETDSLAEALNGVELD
ncbi:related to stilbene synthase 2 [Phialocephala subalpina]|uniref:Related to stilbene synthase 2 n=1 Tax=Phialocephala subalpina TaxID=576137 RepID=A0A1L7WHI9_9HELO|nr:related to stilbene synthase 2 [Phialocephala subalpina]